MPAKSKAQQRFFGMVRKAQKDPSYKASPAVRKAAKSMKKKDVKDFAKTKTNKLPEKVKGGADGSERTCKHCGQAMTKHAGRLKGQIRNPDKSPVMGSFVCQNDECPFYKEGKMGKGTRYKVDIVKKIQEHVVSEPAEIILDGEKYLLEVGDKIIIDEND